MTGEIKYKSISDLLTGIKKGGVAPVYLLYGDEFLYKSAFKGLLDSIVSPSKQSLGYEALDGGTADIHEIIARLNTFPLLPGAKVIAVHDTQIFYSKAGTVDLLKRARQAFDKEKLKESARYFVRVLSVAGLSLDDVGHGEWETQLGLGPGEASQVRKEAVDGWLHHVIDYCLGEKIGVPAHDQDADVLNEAILKGFPKTNYLVLTTELVDKRRKLYKTIKEIGVVIDCSVAQGEKAADKRQQKQILIAYMEKALSRAGKTMATDGFEALYEKTGGGLRNFSNELDKLIVFVGDRKEILADDVNDALETTKQDPIFELSNAIGERDTRTALILVESLLKANFFSLQILSAVINQVRKLILASDFVRSMSGDGWKKGMSYGTFQKILLPELDKRKGDLLRGNAHPFVVYKALAHSDNYTFDELAGALEILFDTDIRLKTSGQDARLVLEHAILRICGACPDSRGGQK